MHSRSLLLKDAPSVWKGAVTHEQFSRRLRWGLASLALAVFGLAGLSLFYSRSDHEARAGVGAANLSRLLAQDLDATFDKVDLALLSVKDVTERQLSSTAADPTLLAREIAGQVKRQPDIGALRLADADGTVLVGTDVTKDVHMNASEREFFKRLRDAPNAGLVFSEPIIGQMSGKWSMVLARRISGKSGSFQGVVFAVLWLEDFQRRFAALDLGQHGVVSLRDSQLGTVVRYPEPENISSTVGNRTVSKEWPVKLKTNPLAGTYEAVGLDGRNRVLAYTRVTEYPFYVIVGLDPDDYLVPWWSELWKTTTALVILAVCSLVFARMLAVAWRDRENEAQKVLNLTRGALERSEERLRLVLERSGMGLWTFCPQNGASTATPMCKALLGLKDAAESDLQTMVTHVCLDDKDSVLQAIDKASKGQASELEFEVDLPSGRRWIAWTVATNANSIQAPTEVTVLSHDVTQRVRERHRLQDEQQRKDEFLAILSHELRGPLAPIRNSFEIMRHSRHPPSIERAGAVVERQLKHLVRLTDDLLDVSRIAQGKMYLRPECVAVSSLVQSSVESSQALLDAGAHRFSVTLPVQPLFVQADPVRMTQVLSNLLNNAARYTPAGGQVALIVSAKESQVCLEVTDNGAGIPLAELPHVFEMFAQGHRSLERAQGGLGIGLALVRRLVEMHGGTVEAESDGLGHGSTFRVTLTLVVPIGHEVSCADIKSD
jgi:signal transduction histidine kinase